MWRIALFLIFTLIAVPLLTFYYDEPLTPVQWETMKILLLTYGSASLICFIISSLTDNYSQVDKLWSVMPIPYVWIAAYMDEFGPRTILMALLVSIWGIRLTYNFARRGGYSWKFWKGEEDYRWSILRAKPPFQQKWKWVLFNFFFISFYQMGLVLMMTFPIVKSMQSEKPLGLLDYILSALMIGLIVMEFVADQQQYNYQQEKHRLKKSGDPLPKKYKIGFTHTGLWAWMRHPNYFAEQAIWVVFYFFSVYATGVWINWSIAGCLLIILLFKGSSDFSESISASIYPDYQRYQKTVGRFLPLRKKFRP